MEVFRQAWGWTHSGRPKDGRISTGLPKYSHPLGLPKYFHLLGLPKYFHLLGLPKGQQAWFGPRTENGLRSARPLDFP